MLSYYATVWVPDSEETEQQGGSHDAELPFMRRVRVAEQNSSCIGAVDVEPLNYQCCTGVMVAGGEGRGKCVLQTVRDSGSGISIKGEAGLRRLQPHFPGLPTAYPYV